MHIMLDLETLSSSSNAAIIAIGAVRFDMTNMQIELDNTFYRTISPKSAQQSGGEIDGNSVLWWFMQPEEARAEFIGDSNASIESALNDFSKWVRETPCEGIWAHGSYFDNVVLSNAYLRLKRTPPWDFFELNRCYSTVAYMHPEIPFVKEGIEHHALHDAISQAKHLCEILKNKGD